jgi:hypothetical protein
MSAKRSTISLIASMACIVLSSPAAAYIGPGAGLSAIGTAVAVFGAVFLLVVGFVWYPIRRLLRRGKVNEDQIEKKEGDPQT